MIILTQSTDKINVKLNNAVVANQLMCYTSFRQSDATTFTPSRSAVLTNNTTPVAMLSGVDGYNRGIDFMSIYNADTVAASATIVANISSADYTLWRGVLNAGERLEYNSTGFYVKDAFGATGITYAYGYNLSTTNNFNLSVLANNVSNTATALADVAGLGFPVVANKLYWFRFVIRYTAAAGTTGSRWTINGPATEYLVYSSEYSLAATTLTTNAYLISYDLPAAANTSTTNLNGARAIIEGLIVPTADGTVIARVGSEVLGSAVTAISGSFVEWEEIYSYV